MHVLKNLIFIAKSVIMIDVQTVQDWQIKLNTLEMMDLATSVTISIKEDAQNATNNSV